MRLLKFQKICGFGIDKVVKLGFHMSISNGFEHMYREVKRLGCECIQIFVKNPRSWSKKEWRKEDISLFREKFSYLPVFSHLSYLPNLAKGSERDITGFLDEIELSLMLGIRFIVIHCGSSAKKEEGLKRISEAINLAHENFPVNILIENSAGYGNSVGATVDEISRIFERLKKKESTKLCVDTAHLFQAGVDIRDKRLWEEFLASIDKSFGKDSIGLIHLNDSKTDLGSKIDRHWHIGRGKLGRKTFIHILNDPRLINTCAIMETPGMGKMDHINMKTVRSLLLPLMSHSLS